MDRIYGGHSNKSLIFETTTPSDNGVYDLFAICNERGNLIHSPAIELIVIALLKFTPEPTAQFLELGSSSEIPCKAQGMPTPLVKWELDNSPNLPENVEDNNGTLIFKNVTFGHRGNYTCIASNSQGTIRASVVVDVVIAPR
jgi:Immunoglobulin domain